MLLLLDQARTCSGCCFSIKMLLQDQQAVSWSGTLLWRYSIRHRHEFFCFSASKSKTGFVYLPNHWVISCGVLIGSASENIYVCAQLYTCGLSDACKLLSWVKPVPRWLQDQGCAVCCCLVCCGFCQNCNYDPERDLPATTHCWRKIALILLRRNSFPKPHLVPSLCLIAIY